MVKMISLEMPKVGISRFSEVQEIVDTFLGDVALHNASQEAGGGVNREQKA
jgi:hypothetical protein